MSILCVILAWLAADITVVVPPSLTNVVITITVQPALAAPVAVSTNVTVVRAATAVLPPDARASLPRSIPMPPMPPMRTPQIHIKDWSGDPSKFTWKKLDAPWLRPLPSADDAYRADIRAAAARAASGLRRSE